LFRQQSLFIDKKLFKDKKKIIQAINPSTFPMHSPQGKPSRIIGKTWPIIDDHLKGTLYIKKYSLIVHDPLKDQYHIINKENQNKYSINSSSKKILLFTSSSRKKNSLNMILKRLMIYTNNLFFSVLLDLLILLLLENNPKMMD
jgi:hypothetical protein